MCPHSLRSVWDSPWGTGSQGESPPCTQIHLTCFAVVSKLDEHLWTRMIIIPWKDELINNYNNERAGVITPVLFSTCHLRNMGWAVDVTSRTLPTLFWDREGQRSVTKKPVWRKVGHGGITAEGEALKCDAFGYQRRGHCREGKDQPAFSLLGLCSALDTALGSHINALFFCSRLLLFFCNYFSPWFSKACPDVY